MQRRKLTLMAGSSILALAGTGRGIFTQAAAAVPPLGSGLTPMGSEAAGNAAGTIPAWTGGMTEIPAGIAWNPDETLPPDFFASDAMLYEVNTANMAQYAAVLSDGLQTLIRNRGFRLEVYPTRRTAAMPQWVYDNIALNASRAAPETGGARMGFNGAFGGVPFPVPDTADPYAAGAQIVWNHEARWSGTYFHYLNSTYSVSSGQATLVNAARAIFEYEYYNPANAGNFDGYFCTGASTDFAPSTQIGSEIINKVSSNPTRYPTISWQLLAGQGRVRKDPNVQYETPSSYANGIVGYDEYYGFNGPLDEYDWKLIGKQEMLIPYNNNKTFHMTAAESHLPHFYNPEAVRWELHRVWVVEATLHQGRQNILSRRKLYIDEDSWIIGVVDAWDKSDDIYKTAYVINANFPNLPGTIYANCMCYNLRTADYVTLLGSFKGDPTSAAWTFGPAPAATFEPQSMAAAASY